jgi:hypothetical protein
LIKNKYFMQRYAEKNKTQNKLVTGREITRYGASNLASFTNTSIINPGGNRSADWDAFIAALVIHEI